MINDIYNICEFAHKVYMKSIEELEKYLENLMEHSYNPLVAKTLYEPFYLALKGERI